MIDHGPWKIVSSQEVYRDPWLAVQRDEVLRPDGSPGSYATVQIKRGVSVLAMDDKSQVYLTSEFHYAVGRVTLEVVSGGVDGNESVLDAARRELAEELGIMADEFIDLGFVDPFTASIFSPTQLFLARGLTFGERTPDCTEVITCVQMSLKDAIDAVMRSEITHAPSCAVILKAARHLESKPCIET